MIRSFGGLRCQSKHSRRGSKSYPIVLRSRILLDRVDDALPVNAIIRSSALVSAPRQIFHAITDSEVILPTVLGSWSWCGGHPKARLDGCWTLHSQLQIESNWTELHGPCILRKTRQFTSVTVRIRNIGWRFSPPEVRAASGWCVWVGRTTANLGAGLPLFGPPHCDDL
jgi:hypothetical protein